MAVMLPVPLSSDQLPWSAARPQYDRTLLTIEQLVDAVIDTPLNRFGAGERIGREPVFWLDRLTHFMVGGYWEGWLEEQRQLERFKLEPLLPSELDERQSRIIAFRTDAFLRLLIIALHHMPTNLKTSVIENIWWHESNKCRHFRGLKPERQARIAEMELTPILNCITKDELFFVRLPIADHVTRETLTWLWGAFIGPLFRYCHPELN